MSAGNCVGPGLIARHPGESAGVRCEQASDRAVTAGQAIEVPLITMCPGRGTVEIEVYVVSAIAQA